MLIGAIADDFTGASDLALTLTREGVRTMLVIGTPEDVVSFGDSQAVVIALKSRTAPASEAVAQSLSAARHLLAAGARQLFFKYCSTFDSTDAGNIGPVTDALLDLLGESLTIACPAFPANARTVYRGHLFVGDALLSESSMKDHPLTPMRDPNLVRVLSRQTKRPVLLVPLEVVRTEAELEAALTLLEGIAIVDAIEDADLLHIGRAARNLRLVTGGSAVAQGLAGNFLSELQPNRHAAPLRVEPGRTVVLAGSCSNATRRQVANGIASGMPALKLDPIAIAQGRQTLDGVLDFVASTPSDVLPLIYSSTEPDEISRIHDCLGRAASGALIERFLSQIAAALATQGTTRFIVAGGETSGAVVAALGIEALSIGPEIDPGIPWTATTREPYLALVLKSGNFGSDDFFTKAAGMLP